MPYDAMMDEAARTLLYKALVLDDRDRAHLATELLRSLDEPDSDSQEEVDRLWAIEIERRSNQLRTGSSRGVPWDEVRSRIEHTLASRESAHRITSHKPYDLWYDAPTVGADLVAETWISHGPRADDAAFDPQAGDGVTVGDDDEPPIRGRVTRRAGDKVWVQLEPGRSVAPPVAPHGEPDQA